MALILIIIGILLIVYSIYSIKKQQNMQNSTTDVFKNILEDKEEDLNDYKLELGKLRRDIGESLNDLQQEILEIKIFLNMIKEENADFDNKKNDTASRLMEMNKKTLEIWELLEKGYADEDICREMDITKGEILLVKNLYMK